jgi:hypothetical protein
MGEGSETTQIARKRENPSKRGAADGEGDEQASLRYHLRRMLSPRWEKLLRLNLYLSFT